ncbi:MAG: UDP-N-acetylmuramoyl-L-alanyl-D-glutamate--2,6-diaminopimelate ligase, partial [Actinomycetota bacterium]
MLRLVLTLDGVLAILEGAVRRVLYPYSSSHPESFDIADLAYDSRRVTPGSLFFCLRGRRDDGHRYGPEAVEEGAVALACERPLEVAVPQVLVSDTRAAMNKLAAAFFGHPSRRLRLVGVTGTNGKTTTAYLLESMLSAAGERAGLVGTVETRWPGPRGVTAESARTTPESVDLQRILSKMVSSGVTSCAVEVTSIGLAQGRVEGTFFEVATFTNLTQDHLDYHETIDSYYRAKRSLFTPERTRRALVNLDDPWGARLCSETEVETLTFGIDSRAELRAEEVERSAKGSRFRAVGAGLDLELEVPMPGAFNVSNVLAAAGAAALLGARPEAIADGVTLLAARGGVPGRFEPVDRGQEFSVIVDYAHTPDGLANVLRAARETCPRGDGRVIVVFGCGGDRDRAKRPLMGKIAAKGADLVFVTSDNPRSEDPLEIIAEIEGGLARARPALSYRLIPDRAAAIGAAVSEARPGDVVVVAGKGHESYQELGGRRIPFDDRVVATEALERGRGR